MFKGSRYYFDESSHRWFLNGYPNVPVLFIKIFSFAQSCYILKFSSMTWYSYLGLLFCLMILKVRISEAEIEIFHPQVHSTNGCNSQRWSKLKPGASSRSPIWEVGAQALELSCCNPSYINTELIRSGAPGIHMGSWYCRWQLHVLSYSVTPWVYFWSH